MSFYLCICLAFSFNSSPSDLQTPQQQNPVFACSLPVIITLLLVHSMLPEGFHKLAALTGSDSTACVVWASAKKMRTPFLFLIQSIPNVLSHVAASWWLHNKRVWMEQTQRMQGCQEMYNLSLKVRITAIFSRPIAGRLPSAKCLASNPAQWGLLYHHSNINESYYSIYLYSAFVSKFSQPIRIKPGLNFHAGGIKK